MASGIKISQLPLILSAMLTDFFPVVQAGVTSSETLNQVMNLFGPNIQLSSFTQVTGLGTASTKTASDNSKTIVASVESSVTNGNIPQFADTFGSLSDSGIANTQLALLGGATFSGTVLLNGTQTATNAAATVGYVNSVATGLTIIGSVLAGTTANLNATYNNGSSGVGATLTNAGTQAAFSTDGVTPAVNSRILVKNQSTAADNGVYSLTTVGSGSTNWVLTRTTDYNSAAQIQPGDLVIVQSGTTLALTSWLQTATVTTVGTDAINFTQFSVSPASLGQAAFKAVTNNALASVASVSGSFTTGHILVAADISGTVSDGGATTQFLLKANNLSDVASVATSLVNLGLGTPTGTGNVVLGTNPVITSPRIITSILDVNGNGMLGFTAATSAVNFITISNSATTNALGINASGSDTNIALSIVGKGTGGVGIQGTSSGANASAGFMGEYVVTQLVFASATGLTTATAKNIISISLSAGDWDIDGNVYFNASTGMSQALCGINTNGTAALPDNSLVGGLTTTTAIQTVGGHKTATTRVNITSPTTYFLVAQATFSAGTVTASGQIAARRLR
jgi:hypothetical protein